MANAFSSQRARISMDTATLAKNFKAIDRATYKVVQQAFIKTDPVLLNHAIAQVQRFRRLKRRDLVNKDRKKAFLFTERKIRSKTIDGFSLVLRATKRSPSLIRFVRGSKLPRDQKGVPNSRRRRWRLRYEVVPGQVRTTKDSFIIRGKYKIPVVVRKAKRVQRVGTPFTKNSTQRKVHGQTSGAGIDTLLTPEITGQIQKTTQSFFNVILAKLWRGMVKNKAA